MFQLSETIGGGLVVGHRAVWSPEPVNVELTLFLRAMDRSQESSTQGAAFGRAEGTIDGGSAVPLWARKAGEASSGYCALTRQVWVHSRAQWLPMEFLEDEVRRDLALHGRVLTMDSDEFGAHSVGFFKRADQ